jgi:glutamyl-tRNA reductase
MFFIDIGVPRNVDPEVSHLDNAFLYDLDDLQDIAASNAEERRREGDRAEQIILDERQRFDGWLSERQAVPTICELRGQAEAIRVEAIERAASRLGLDDMGEGQREALDVLTRSIVNKLLHSPLTRLRAESGRDEAPPLLEAARELFGLDDRVARTGRATVRELPVHRDMRQGARRTPGSRTSQRAATIDASCDSKQSPRGASSFSGEVSRRPSNGGRRAHPGAGRMIVEIDK